ncbi:Hypothetical protein HVR_LOCUS1077 [uncultured virus]|nr:Hypothetical protein HVR_LOCUS1077 [uncultured virus]
MNTGVPTFNVPTVNTTTVPVPRVIIPAIYTTTPTTTAPTRINVVAPPVVNFPPQTTLPLVNANTPLRVPRVISPPRTKVISPPRPVIIPTGPTPIALPTIPGLTVPGLQTIPGAPTVPRIRTTTVGPTIIPNIVSPPRPVVPVPGAPTVPKIPTTLRSPTVPRIPTTLRSPAVPRIVSPVTRIPVPIPVAPTTAVVPPIVTTPTVPVITIKNPFALQVPIVTPQITGPKTATTQGIMMATPRTFTFPELTRPTPTRLPSPVRSPPVARFPVVVSPQRTMQVPVVGTINAPQTTAPLVPNLESPAEMFVDIVIKEQDADIMDEKEYLGYVRYLLNDQAKYDIFSRLFPNNTCGNVLVRMETVTSQAPRIRPSEDALVNCIRAKETAVGSVAVNFSYQNHANLLWFDTTNKIINRYDPQVSGDERGQDTMDDTIRGRFELLFPDYVYLGNTLEDWQCVQGVRGTGRIYKSDYYCQDYSLLYAINRINGMSHEEAAFALVARGEDVLIDLAELLRALAYRIRAEMGKQIPERFQTWRPTMQV